MIRGYYADMGHCSYFFAKNCHARRNQVDGFSNSHDMQGAERYDTYFAGASMKTKATKFFPKQMHDILFVGKN